MTGQQHVLEPQALPGLDHMRSPSPALADAYSLG
jgi:hypothetical protein